jgi:hypothetical protein
MLIYEIEECCDFVRPNPAMVRIHGNLDWLLKNPNNSDSRIATPAERDRLPALARPFITPQLFATGGTRE